VAATFVGALLLLVCGSRRNRELILDPFDTDCLLCGMLGRVQKPRSTARNRMMNGRCSVHRLGQPRHCWPMNKSLRLNLA
jgi:hypothetical protein